MPKELFVWEAADEEGIGDDSHSYTVVLTNRGEEV